MPRSRNAMSRVKKRRKKATVERSVQTSRRVVKRNHPWVGVSAVSAEKLGW